MASKRISGITIEIDGDVQKLNKALKSADSQIKTTSNSLRDVNKLLKLDPGNADLLVQKQKNLQGAITATKDRLQQLQNVSKEGVSDEEWDALQREIIATEQDLKKLENEYKNFGSVAQQQIVLAGTKVQEVGDKISKTGNSIASVGKSLTTYLTLPIVALGTAAVKVTADFDEGMSKVQAISGATGDELEALRDKAKEMGETTKFSATESAEAMEYMAMAGWKTEDMLNGISGVMDLAAASGEDLATTSDIVTDALTAFGLSAEDAGHFSDILAATASNANTNVGMMGQTFKYVAPLAGTLGYSVEDVSTAIGLMANSGIKATQAGTSLRALLTRLAKPTKQSQQAMDDLGISMTNADGSMRPLGELLNDMRGKFENLTESEKTMYGAMLAGQNGMSGFLAIMNATTQDVEKLTKAIDGSEGAAHNMAETMQDNLAGQLKILKSQLEGVAIQIGEQLMPYIKKGVTWIQKVVEKFSKLNKRTKDTIVKIAGIVAACGPLIAIGGKLVSGIGTVVKGVGTIITKIPGLIAGIMGQTVATEGATVAQTGLNMAMMAMPIIGLVAAIGAGIAALVSFATSARDTQKDLEGITEIEDSIAETNDRIIESSQEFADAIHNAGLESKTAAEQAKNAADTLLEISESGDRSEASLAKMAVAVRQLNELYPDLGLEIDRTTGELNKSGDEIQAFVEKASRMSKVDRANEMLKISLEEVTAATRDQIRAQYDYDRAVANREALEARRDALDEVVQSYNRGELSLDEYRQKVSEVDAAITVSEYGLLTYNNATAAGAEIVSLMTSNLEIYDDAVTSASESLDAANLMLETAQGAAENAQIALDNYNAAQEKTTEVVNQAAEAHKYSISVAGEEELAWQQLDATQQQLALDVVASMTAIQEAVSSSVSSQMDMFSAWEQKSTISTDTLLKNMQDQIDGVTKWEENLVKLSEMGIDEGLLQHLANMGPEGRAYVEAFAGMSSEEMAKANELWKEKLDIEGFTNEAGQKLTEGVGMLAAGSEEAFVQLGEDLGVKASETGGYIGQGLIDGMANISEEVLTGAQQLGEDTIDAINTEAGVASPSTKTLETGKFIDMGLANGMKNNMSVITAAINALTNYLDTNLINKLRSYNPTVQTIALGTVTALATGLRNGQGNVNSSVQGLVTAVQQGGTQIQSQQSAWNSAGIALSNGLAQGIMAGQSAVIAAAAAVAAAAISSAQSALQINSPSKVADKLIGRNFDYGVAQGIENGTPDVIDSVKRMTSAMVNVPGRSSAFNSGMSTVNNLDYGGTVINVYGAEGQNVERLAEIVEQRLNVSYARQQAAFGR